MIRAYRTTAVFAVLVAAGAFGVLVLASLDYLSDLQFAGVWLWPAVIGLLLASIFVASWAIAKAKGRPGWVGLVLPFLDVIGLAVLFKLQDRGSKAARREPGQ